MHSRIFWLVSLILISLALPQKAKAQETTPSEYLEDIQDLLNRTKVIPFYTEDDAGNQIPVTTIAVEGVVVPGTSDKMGKPIIIGSFAGTTLMAQELYVCDEKVSDFEASCIVIPASYQETIATTLINLFDLLSPMVWEEFLKKNSEQIPEPQKPPGITATT
jgi:hypothetical protein